MDENLEHKEHTVCKFVLGFPTLLSFSFLLNGGGSDFFQYRNVIAS